MCLDDQVSQAHSGRLAVRRENLAHHDWREHQDLWDEVLVYLGTWDRLNQGYRVHGQLRWARRGRARRGLAQRRGPAQHGPAQRGLAR